MLGSQKNEATHSGECSGRALTIGTPREKRRGEKVQKQTHFDMTAGLHKRTHREDLINGKLQKQTHFVDQANKHRNAAPALGFLAASRT
jgi:hypothetical protein